MIDNDVSNKQIHKALLKVQSNLSGVTKEQDGVYSKYADLRKVMLTIQSPLNENKIYVSHGYDLDAENNIFYVTTSLTHDSGEYVSNKIGFPMVKKDPHGIASLSTYGRRYGLMALLGLAPKDDDGTDAMGGFITDAHKSEYQELLKSPAFDGKHSKCNDRWKSLKFAIQAEDALSKMKDAIAKHSEKLMDQELTNAIQGDK